ncbi:hypothetical protein CAEBREN_15343 [Caenorhabditis brenneri]|uniref:Uncharacterized protein n=1 Tax=Caenorhabditis brenneri TaxID=135651 RepID=G0NZK0_CAEBE|nr:hypothetical protein CAEBREN_15343 [Caenorhabditis brenneri]
MDAVILRELPDPANCPRVLSVSRFMFTVIIAILLYSRLCFRNTR